MQVYGIPFYLLLSSLRDTSGCKDSCTNTRPLTYLLTYLFMLLIVFLLQRIPGVHVLSQRHRMHHRPRLFWWRQQHAQLLMCWWHQTRLL